jgi:hypothetical protein
MLSQINTGRSYIFHLCMASYSLSHILQSYHNNFVDSCIRAVNMNEVVVLEWKFSPTDYFESPIEIKQDDYTMMIADGKVEAKIDSAVYDATPSMRDSLHDVLNSRFLSYQLSSRKAYKLSKPTKTRVEHADGRQDYILEVEPGHLKITFHPITLLYYDKDGNVVADAQTERAKSLDDLVSKHYKDEVLKSLLRSYNASVSDPDDELVHLYEIYEALSRKFRGNKMADSRKAISTLGKYQNLSPKKWEEKWKKFTGLCNDAPLKQGRHGGKHETLRDATDAELSEARGTAQAMIEAYLKYLDVTATSVGP